jgi:hypothetical protein
MTLAWRALRRVGFCASMCSKSRLALRIARETRPGCEAAFDSWGVGVVRRLPARTPLVVAMGPSSEVLLFAINAGVEAKRRIDGCAGCCDVWWSAFARRDSSKLAENTCSRERAACGLGPIRTGKGGKGGGEGARGAASGASGATRASNCQPFASRLRCRPSTAAPLLAQRCTRPVPVWKAYVGVDDTPCAHLVSLRAGAGAGARYKPAAAAATSPKPTVPFRVLSAHRVCVFALWPSRCSHFDLPRSLHFSL